MDHITAIIASGGFKITINITGIDNANSNVFVLKSDNYTFITSC